MEIKVRCPCTQEYKFDVEPVNGAMPCAVNCPTCGADGTHLANEIIAQTLAAQTAPAPVAPPPPPPVAAAPEPGKLRINRPAPASNPGSIEAPPPAPPPQRIFTRTLEPDKPPPKSDASIPRGILGGVIAGSIAAAIWYFLTMATGREFGMVAWFVGIIAGLGVRIMGRDGNPELGYVAAVCAALAILGGQFLVVNTTINKVLAGTADIAYEARFLTASAAVKAKSDLEIKDWLGKHGKLDREASDQDIESFRQTEQPKYQEFLNGHPSKQEFEKKYLSTIGSFSMKFGIFKATIGFFTMLWVAFGILSAYRIGAG